MEGGVNMTTRNVTAADFGSRYEAPGAELVRIACQFQSRILLKSGEMQVNRQREWKLRSQLRDATKSRLFSK